MAVNVFVNDGTLFINGDNANDNIVIETTTRRFGSFSIPFYRVTAEDNFGNRMSRQFSAFVVDDIHASTLGGSDTVRNNTNLPSQIFGGSGIDFLFGGSNRDVLDGGNERDIIEGGDGDDELRGGAGRDDLFGQLGDDTLLGGSGNDLLDGGENDDRLEGSLGRDTLLGGADRDILFGGSDNDILDGGSGADGLFGGTGRDSLEGGSGGDRFLVEHDSRHRTSNETIVDLRSNDAEIRFFSGQTSWFNDYTVGHWSSSEIEEIDEAFDILMRRTGSTNLLKRPDGGVIEMHRYGSNKKLTPAVNNDQRIGVFDNAFDDGPGGSVFLVLHEVGHYWDEPKENRFIDDFREVSAWELEWGQWKRLSGKFVTPYAQTNPLEDWAETFAVTLMVSAGKQDVLNDLWQIDQSEIQGAQEKIDIVNDFLDTK